MKTKIVCRTLSVLSMIALPACSAMVGQEKLSAPEQIKMSKLDVNQYPVTKTVCDPMGGTPDPRSNTGLKADLYWMGAGKSAPVSAADLIARGTRSDRTLFFTQLNTPTRMFDVGFNNDVGDPIKDDSGNKLIENFALSFTSVLRLAPDQAEGLYEFSILSDDGAVLRLRDENGVYKVMVDNDGDHPTRMGCGSPLVDMKRDTEKLMQLDYFQGPRYHIALMLLMRKVTPAADGSFARDLSCGVTSNNAWFDPNNNSAPQPTYTALASRGWRLLTADNYAIPNSLLFNPCKDGAIPVLTSVRLGESFSNSAALDWDTDLMSTSQIVVTDAVTGAQIISMSDNVLTLHHHVSVLGLNAGTAYTLQAVSISDTYGKGLSNQVPYRTAQ